MNKDKKSKTVETKWAGRSLKNYKEMHQDVAKDKGVLAEFNAARTLTAARKIAFGMKRGNSK